MTKKENRIFGKTLKEILFEEINGEVYPRILGDYDKLTKEAKEILEQLPHLYETGYKGSWIKYIRKDEVDKKTLKTWEKYGFKPKSDYFKALFEYYIPLTKINLIFNILPVEEKEETETLSPEEQYYEGFETDEAYEIFQQIDDNDFEFMEDEEDW